jgi:hypothetical protein
MTNYLKKVQICLIIAAAALFSSAASALPWGFYVAHQGRNSIDFQKNENGRVYVHMTTYSMRNQSFSDIVNAVAHANGSSSCTKMKDHTPIGGPRFHCQYNMNRTPYTLHLIPYYEWNYVLSVTISGDNYPGFGITYDDVRNMIDYWFNN